MWTSGSAAGKYDHITQGIDTIADVLFLPADAIQIIVSCVMISFHVGCVKSNEIAQWSWAKLLSLDPFNLFITKQTLPFSDYRISPFEATCTTFAIFALFAMFKLIYLFMWCRKSVKVSTRTTALHSHKDQSTSLSLHKEPYMETIPQETIYISSSYKILMSTIVCCALLSIPWEFVRIYQNEVAKRVAMSIQVCLVIT